MIVSKHYGKEGNMDGGVRGGTAIDGPIAKPNYPLPAVFSPRRRSELPTRSRENNPSKERAHFYRKGTTSEGSPIYGFFITEENAERAVKRNQ
jgi:hypothetical protein